MKQQSTKTTIVLFVSLTRVPAAAAESAAAAATICLVVVRFVAADSAAAAAAAAACCSFRKRRTLPQSQPQTQKVDLVLFVWLPQTQFSFISYFNFMNF